MDLNYLYHRRGVSLAMAANAACAESRSAHQSLARGYSSQIIKARAARGASA